MKRLKITLILAFLSHITFADNWFQAQNFPGTARLGACGFSIGTKGYIGTGLNGSTYYKDLWEWNQSTNTWTQMADLPGVARQLAVGFSIGSKGYIGTGSSSFTTYYNDFYEWDQTANTWSTKANFPGTTRSNASGFVIGTKGYISSGFYWDGATAFYYSDLYEWSQASNTWATKADYGWPRAGAVGFAIGIKGYISTGLDGTSFVSLGDLEQWDQTTNTWSSKASLPAGKERDHAVGFSIGTKGYVGTGVKGASFLGDYWEWDQTGNTWTVKSTLCAPGREEAVGFSIGAKGYIGTGYDGSYKNDLWEWGTAYSSCGVLPIELVYFSGAASLYSENEEEVGLHWQTSSETNNDFFTIERSGDGKKWIEIEKIHGVGNSNSILNYEFTDHTLIGEGVVYYKLKQTDYDGQYEYYGPLAVRLVPSHEWKLVLQNIPIIGEEEKLNANLLLSENSDIMVNILDLQGRVLSQQKINAFKGSTLLNIDLKNIQRGVYFLKVFNSKISLQQRFVKI